MTNLLVLYYSMYGNVYKMAQAVAEGAKAAGDVNVSIKTVTELIPPDVIQADPGLKRGREMQKDVPIATLEDLANCDGLLVGSPTRFGNMTAQMRNFWDRTTKLWLKGTLINKPVGLFCSTASLHGGQETTLVSMMFTMIHHGMLIVGVPYSVPELLTTPQGGTPYGPSHTAGPESQNALIAEEIAVCKALGQRVAEISKKLKAGS